MVTWQQTSQSPDHQFDIRQLSLWSTLTVIVTIAVSVSCPTGFDGEVNMGNFPWGLHGIQREMLHGIFMPLHGDYEIPWRLYGIPWNGVSIPWNSTEPHSTLQSKSMKYFTWNPMESPWKISRAYFLHGIPPGMKRARLFCSIAACFQRCIEQHVDGQRSLMTLVFDRCANSNVRYTKHETWVKSWNRIKWYPPYLQWCVVSLSLHNFVQDFVANILKQCKRERKLQCSVI